MPGVLQVFSRCSSGVYMCVIYLVDRLESNLMSYAASLMDTTTLLKGLRVEVFSRWWVSGHDQHTSGFGE